MINAKQLAKPFYSRTPRLKTDANRSADETDTKRLAKPFYSETPMLETDANRFTDSSLKNQRVLSEVRIFKIIRISYSSECKSFPLQGAARWTITILSANTGFPAFLN